MAEKKKYIDYIEDTSTGEKYYIKSGDSASNINIYSNVTPSSPVFSSKGTLKAIGEIGNMPMLADTGYSPALSYWSNSSKNNFFGLAGLTKEKTGAFYSIGYGDQYTSGNYDFSFALIAADGKIDTTHSNHSFEIHNLKEDGFLFTDSDSPNTIGLQIMTGKDKTTIGNFGAHAAQGEMSFSADGVAVDDIPINTEYLHTIKLYIQQSSTDNIAYITFTCKCKDAFNVQSFLKSFNGMTFMCNGHIVDSTTTKQSITTYSMTVTSDQTDAGENNLLFDGRNDNGIYVTAFKSISDFTFKDTVKELPTKLS